MKIAVIPLLFALAACDGGAPAASAPAVPAPVPVVASVPAPAGAPNARPAACPDFDVFLARFEASADAQRDASADPLTMVRIDPDAQPEPVPVTTQVPRDRVPFPVLADAATRAAEGSRVTVTARGANARDVTVAMPDSGAQVRLAFELRDCWTLVKVDDQSM